MDKNDFSRLNTRRKEGLTRLRVCYELGLSEKNYFKEVKKTSEYITPQNDWILVKYACVIELSDVNDRVWQSIYGDLYLCYKVYTYSWSMDVGQHCREKL